MGRNLNLTDNGELRFFEGTGGGVNKVTIKTASTLAADYTLTLPPDDGGANEFLQTDGSGVLTWGTSTATLASAYTNGAKITTASGVPVEIEVGSSSANVALLLDQDDDFAALSITKDGTGAGEGILLVNSGTGIGVSIQCTAVAKGLFLNQDGAASALDIDQDGAATAFTLNQAQDNIGIDLTQAGDAVGLNVLKTGTVAGDAVAIENDGTGKGLFINQDGAGVALDIDQDGAAAGLTLNQATDNIAVDIVQAGDAVGLNILKSGAGVGDAVAIENDGVGRGLFINQDGNNVGLLIDQDGDGIGLVINQAGVSSVGFWTQTIDQAGFILLKTGTGGGTVLDVENDGTGIGVFINQDGAATALSIDSEATASPLIDLAPVTGNARGDIAFNSARTADPSAPATGDMWFDATENRLLIETAGSVTETLGGRWGSSFGEVAAVTLSTGVATVARGTTNITSESGASDDCITLTTASARIGDTVILRATSGDTITLKHASNNIFLDGSSDKALVNGNQIMLIFDGANWDQLTPMMVLP